MWENIIRKNIKYYMGKYKLENPKMRENTGQKNSEYGYFYRSVKPYENLLASGSLWRKIRSIYALWPRIIFPNLLKDDVKVTGFAKLKFSPALFEKILLFVYLEFKIENKWVLKFQNLFSKKKRWFKNKLYQAVTFLINDYL